MCLALLEFLTMNEGSFKISVAIFDIMITAQLFVISFNVVVGTF